MTTGPGAGGVVLEMRDVVKSFGAGRALDGVSLRLVGGEVHALIGENGAGKSTLMKVLSGAIRPDSGTMTLDGSAYAPRGPRDALARGVAMIYQELAIAPHLSVEANVMLGQERTARGLLRSRENRRIVREALATLDHADLDPRIRAGHLSVGGQQVVELARALISDARLIVFDEPTSSLTARDADRLLGVIGRLRERGLAIVIISHVLEELAQVAGPFTVLRDGRTVATGTMGEVGPGAIIRAMIGRDLGDLYPRTGRTPGDVLLDLSALAGRTLPRRADLTVRRGEVVGIAGLVGAGRTEMLRAVFGLDEVRSGRVTVRGVDSGRNVGPRRRIAEGVGLVSEDRKGEGLALGRSIEDNLTYPSLARRARVGWVDLKARRARATEAARRVGVRARSVGQPVGQLSGGNQQKVAIARLLEQEADVLLLDEPTRGIDVAAKAEVYRLVDGLAAEGRAVLMVSSYLPELFGVCDRLAVMTRGVLSPARPVADWSVDEVMRVATGG